MELLEHQIRTARTVLRRLRGRALQEVMDRSRRSTVGLQFTRHRARTLLVRPTPAQRNQYDEATKVVNEHLKVASPRTARRDRSR
jgi:hypothetical protein